LSAIESGSFASEVFASGAVEEGTDEPRNDANVLVAAEADGATAGDVKGEDDARGLLVELGVVSENGLDLDEGTPNPVKPLNLGAEGVCIAHQWRPEVENLHALQARSRWWIQSSISLATRVFWIEKQ
jgi:hypothetical protein